MSKDFYVYCLRCKERHDLGINHGDDQMRTWVQHAGAIAGLLPLMRAHWSDVSLTTYNQTIDVSWFAEHAGHELGVIDEYGRLLDQCEHRVKCAGCDHQHNCLRKRAHEGACSPSEKDRGT